jgi:hypothetical protein
MLFRIVFGKNKMNYNFRFAFRKVLGGRAFLHLLAFLCLGSVAFFGYPCHAEYSPELAQMLDQEVSSVERAMENLDAQSHPGVAALDPASSGVGMTDSSISPKPNYGPSSVYDGPGDDAWYMRNIWIRVRLWGGISIPGFASLSIIPEIEFLIQRPLPNGWAIYTPVVRRGG